jgi:hypothetical protein
MLISVFARGVTFNSGSELQKIPRRELWLRELRMSYTGFERAKSDDRQNPTRSSIGGTLSNPLSVHARQLRNADPDEAEGALPWVGNPRRLRENGL